MEDILIALAYSFAIIICLLFSIFIIIYFPKKQMKKYILILSFIFIFFNFFMVMLLPFDIYYTNSKIDEPNNPFLKRFEKVLKTNYYINFYILFFGNLSLINFLIGIMQSGEFSIPFKILDGILASAPKLILYFLLTLVIAPFIKDFEYLQYLMMAYKIVQLISSFIFIGVTIVKLPKKMYLYSDIDRTLEYLQFKGYKKKMKIKENNNKVKKHYNKCKLTLEYIKKIEEGNENININDLYINNELNDNNEDDKDNKNNEINNQSIVKLKDICEKLLQNCEDLIKIYNINIDEKNEEKEEKKDKKVKERRRNEKYF